MSDLSGKVALITGAGRGPGRAVALALAAAGARVVVVDLNPDVARHTAEAIALAGGTALVQVADVSNKMAVQTLLYAVIDEWGRIDILANAAHVAPTGGALQLDEWEWNRTIDVNLKSAFLVAQTTARAMKETGGGLIFNVIRPTGSTSAAVRAARDGLIGLTGALAAEWAGLGIRVEWIDTSAGPASAAAQVVNRCVAT